MSLINNTENNNAQPWSQETENCSTSSIHLQKKNSFNTYNSLCKPRSIVHKWKKWFRSIFDHGNFSHLFFQCFFDLIDDIYYNHIEIAPLDYESKVLEHIISVCYSLMLIGIFLPGPCFVYRKKVNWIFSKGFISFCNCSNFPLLKFMDSCEPINKRQVNKTCYTHWPHSVSRVHKLILYHKPEVS